MCSNVISSLNVQNFTTSAEGLSLTDLQRLVTTVRSAANGKTNMKV